MDFVKNNGVIKSNKGVNIPNEIINLPSITEKDKSKIGSHKCP